MSIYDKASLVLIPSGTKTSKVYSQKPVNGDGDFTFSRSTAATRVNADGNIEKETQNLILQSNSFDTTWNNVNVTLTGGQAGYDGTNNAWKLVGSTSNVSHNVNQGFSVSGVITLSLYVKPSGYNYMLLFAGGYGGTFFDIANGTIGNNLATAPIDSNIESVGSGWYRVSISVNNGVDIGIFPSPNGTSYVYSGDGTSGILIQDAQLEQGLVARDYIETTTAAVEGGITDNVPRLDYTDSSCPALLLEPQRTNVVVQSEYFGGSDWNKGNASVTDNNATSPEGIQNASLLTISAAVGNIYDNVGDSGDFTFSVFAKYVDMQYMRLRSTASYVYFDIQNGSVETELNGTGSIEDYGNGWYRCSVTGNNTNSLAQIFLSDTEGGTPTGTGSALIYGAQFEAGSYPTSYIPTYGTSVTRNQDEADAFNAGDLITDNEGVLFVEFDFAKQDVSQTICLNSNNPSNRIGFWTPATADLHIFATSGGTPQFSTDTGFNLVNGQTYKVAVKWSNNIVTAFANGNLIFTSSTIANPINLYVASMNNSTTTFWDSPVKQYMVFPTALTDQEAIDLTTI